MLGKSLLSAVSVVVVCAAPLAAQDTFREPESKIEVEDWSLECYLNPDRTPQACQVYHRVLMNNATEIALVATFSVPPEGPGILYQISLPLGIDLTAGVTLAVDVDYSVKLPVTRCTVQGCLLEGQLTGAPFNALMTGSVSTLTVQVPGQGALPIPMSLNGFAPAVRRIEEVFRAPPAPEPEPEPTEVEVESAIDTDQTNGIDPALAPVTGVKE